jgi:WD40 repeat protein
MRLSALAVAVTAFCLCGRTGPIAAHAAAPAGSAYRSTAALPLGCTGGCTVWADAYNGPGNGEDIGNAIALAPDGSTVYVTGASLGSSSFDYATIAYDAASGAQRWIARYDGPGEGDDEPAAITLSPDGRTVYVTGESVGSAPGVHDWATIAYDSTTGARLWVQRLSSPVSGDNVATALGVSPDGSRVYVTGWITAFFASNGLPKYDIEVVAYNASTGAPEWAQEYAGFLPPPPNGTDWDVAYALHVAPTSSGDRVVVAGRSDVSSGAADLVVLAYGGITGTPQWTYLYSGPAQNRDIATAITASADGGRVFVAGYDTTAAGDFDYVTAAIDAASGGQLWAQRYDDGSQLDDLALAVAASPDGKRVAVTGTSGDQPGLYERSMTTIVYDAATGVSHWVARQPEPPDGGTGTALVFSADSATLYVAGAEGNDVFGVGVQNAGVQLDDSLALAASYDVSSGAQQWLTSYGTTRQTGASALALSPDGSQLYFTGGAQDSMSDLTTVDLTTAAAPATGVPEAPVAPLLLAGGVAAAVLRGSHRVPSRASRKVCRRTS